MRFLRIGICALVAFGVLAHGGVEDWARAFFETGTGLLFLAWAALIYLQREETVLISPLLPPLAGLLLVVLVQLLFHTTASTFNTREEFTLLLAETLLVFLAMQAFRTLEEWREFVWFMMIFGFPSVDIWNPAAPYVQRKVVLVQGNALRRNALRAVRKPEPFCGICGVVYSAGAGAADAWKSAARALVHRGTFRGGFDRRVVSGGITRGHHQFRGAGGDHHGVDERATNGEKTGAGGSRSVGGGAVDGVLAGGKRDYPAVLRR